MSFFESSQLRQAELPAQDAPAEQDNLQRPAITAKNVYLSYRSIAPVKRRNIKQASGFKDDAFKQKGRVEHFEALHGVSFEVGKGEIIGLIGRNGSGKSTLLRVLAGIFEPDKGSVDLHGNTVSLLALGVGFQTQLSGRENIYLSGLLLGFTKAEIDDQIDEIIAFSELGRFIEQPVRTYSSGMQSKLGFAITAILKTDIILVDEVLSVGDAHFKKKSGRKMAELISEKSRTVVIVSHNAETIRTNCEKVIWLHDGDIRRIGPTQEVVDEYEAFMAQYDIEAWEQPKPKKKK
ncbi:MAG: ABC transporter ATP-binding protein [Clostridiales bacterium]|nr:ABC transporter ATP-binding protein [Clostridiales bacterium]